MRQHQTDARAVCTGVDLRRFGDAQKARVIVALVLHGVAQAGQAVELRALARGERGHIRPVGHRDALRRGSGVFAAGHADVLSQRFEELRALVDRLLVGKDLVDLLRAGLGQQAVVDLHAHGAHDVEVVLQHPVIDLPDGTGGAVFDGQDAVAAEAGLDR